MNITGDKERDKLKRPEGCTSQEIKRYMNKRNKRFVKGEESESK